jgi:hypothetical protein
LSDDELDDADRRIVTSQTCGQDDLRLSHGLTGGNPPWMKERRLAASEFADQVAKSRWLRIQCVPKGRRIELMRHIGRLQVFVSVD